VPANRIQYSYAKQEWLIVCPDCNCETPWAEMNREQRADGRRRVLLQASIGT
jgi:hypothetical protein